MLCVLQVFQAIPFAAVWLAMSGSSSTALCTRHAHITLYDITSWSWVNLVNPHIECRTVECVELASFPGLPWLPFLIACNGDRRPHESYHMMVPFARAVPTVLHDLLRTSFQHLKQCGQMKPYPKVFTQVLRSGFHLLGMEGWEASLPSSLASPQRDRLYHYITGWIMHTNLFKCISIYTVASTTLHSKLGVHQLAKCSEPHPPESCKSLMVCNF